MKPVATFPVSIKPSRHLLLVLLLAHSVAAGAVLASEIAPWIAALLLLLVGASLARQRSAASLTGLLLHGA